MSDCMKGGAFRYARHGYVPTGTAMKEDSVMRGKVVFDDGDELPLSYARYRGRKVERFEMDGERFELVRECEMPEVNSVSDCPVYACSECGLRVLMGVPPRFCPNCGRFVANRERLVAR